MWVKIYCEQIQKQIEVELGISTPQYDYEVSQGNRPKRLLIIDCNQSECKNFILDKCLIEKYAVYEEKQK